MTSDRTIEDEITALLNRSQDEPLAAEQAYQLIYRDLKRLAIAKTAARTADATLSATALINEAYVKLVNRGGQWNDRRHFFRVAARAMRQITIDYARTQARCKRGGSQVKLALDESRAPAQPRAEILMAMEEGLVLLRRSHPDWVDVVELRFFGGLSSEEAADMLGISLSSVNRRWADARAWLKDFLIH